jgi:2-keto-3-deoxy-L-rhamnonate aldolase RhmA
VRLQWILMAVAVMTLAGQGGVAEAQKHANPVIDLLAAKQPVFGLYAPANRRARPGAPTPPADSVKTVAQLADMALAYKLGDYVFDGTMEGNFDAAYPPFSDFARAIGAGTAAAGPSRRFSHPLFVKTPEIAPDAAIAGDRIAKQLNTGAAGVVFVSVESADEVKTGLAAMRFKSKGGTRPDDVGDAPARWGMSDKEYREKADVWPLNPRGELVNFTIVETKAGLAKIREIAAVKGIGVLLPGAGTLRGVFTSADANGQRVFDEKAWEDAIQQVLAACKEFNVACGYPARSTDVEMRMKQGFSVFVVSWGDDGFKTVDIGRKAGGR